MLEIILALLPPLASAIALVVDHYKRRAERTPEQVVIEERAGEVATLRDMVAGCERRGDLASADFFRRRLRLLVESHGERGGIAGGE
jgi:hypothetical protein